MDRVSEQTSTTYTIFHFAFFPGEWTGHSFLNSIPSRLSSVSFDRLHPESIFQQPVLPLAAAISTPEFSTHLLSLQGQGMITISRYKVKGCA